MIPIGFTTIVHLFVIIVRIIYDLLSKVYAYVKRVLVSKYFIIMIMIIVSIFVVTNIALIFTLLINKNYSNLTLLELFLSKQR